MATSDGEKILTFGFNTAHDLYEKLKRDAIKLKDNPRSKDECFNFILTAWHLHHDWMKNDKGVSSLARKKHENSELAMKFMMHALEVVANSSKHVRVRNNQNVKDTKFGEVLNWYGYFYGDFPTIITETAEYPLWKLQEILIEYYEWVFDEKITDVALKPNILTELKKCNLQSQD